MTRNWTAEARRAGQNAVEYIKERFGKEMEKIKPIKCIPGENVNYIKPNLINRSDLSKDITLTFRVKNPDRRILIQISDESKNIIYKKKKAYVIPSEMNELVLNLKDLQINPDLKIFKIDVVPRPEVLLDE